VRCRSTESIYFSGIAAISAARPLNLFFFSPGPLPSLAQTPLIQPLKRNLRLASCSTRLSLMFYLAASDRAKTNWDISSSETDGPCISRLVLLCAQVNIRFQAHRTTTRGHAEIMRQQPLRLIRVWRKSSLPSVYRKSISKDT
jgi:hypothetical protein